MSEVVVKDIRGTKKEGRPSNQERSSSKSIEEQARLIVADILLDLRKNVKMMSVQEQTAVLGKLMPLVTQDDSSSATDTSFDILAERCLKIEMRVMAAGASSPTKKAGTSGNTAPKPKGNSARRGTR